MRNIQLSRRRAFAFGCSALLVPARPRELTPAFILGVSRTEKQRIAELGESFRRKFDLPGVSLAVSFRGKLKLLACFGYANRRQGEPVRPDHQFRIASVSKPITAVAVLRLVEQGRLLLDEQVFGPRGHLGRYAVGLTDLRQRARVQQITVRYLLEHSCGGWSNKKGEAPMFAPDALGMPHSELIRWTLHNKPLQTEPGIRYAYSNFGYCLLGRVIESVTGKPYEQAVKELVLNAVDARHTVVGGHTLNQRRPQEVVYYDRYDPYGANMDVTRMDAHGGWISTPADLVRFAQRVNGHEVPADILNRATLQSMTTPRRGHYALGWSVNASGNWWHTGSFNGGSSILARIHDGHCWAVVVNSRSYDERYDQSLDRLPWDIKAAVRKWGKHDLFRCGFA